MASGSRFVRSSKFRHVFGQPSKKEECYQNIKVTRSAWDDNYIRANPKYFAVNWEAGGGGAVAVISYDQQGKLAAGNTPLLAGHKQSVNALDFHPHNDNLIATASEDATIMIWGIPEGGLTETITVPLQTLVGHKRKIGTCQFNPVANNILASSSTDFTVKIWDVETGQNAITAEGHTDIILASEWNSNGSLLATTCKDKKLRLVDPRANAIVSEAASHQGVKGSKCIWIKDKVFSVGFSKNSEREFFIHDPRGDFTVPASRVGIDNSAGSIMPFFDPDTNVLFLAGKGDGNIRYYEVTDEAPHYFYLSEYKSNTPQRGMAFIPKRAVNVAECEIGRALKLTTNLCEPISFRVPRKSDLFQDDIYPDTFSGEASLTAEEWLAGQNAEPKLASLAPGQRAERAAVEFRPVANAGGAAAAAPVAAAPAAGADHRAELEALRARVAFLESEVAQKDAVIHELEAALEVFRAAAVVPQEAAPEAVQE